MGNCFGKSPQENPPPDGERNAAAAPADNNTPTYEPPEPVPKPGTESSAAATQVKPPDPIPQPANESKAGGSKAKPPGPVSKPSTESEAGGTKAKPPDPLPKPGNDSHAGGATVPKPGTKSDAAATVPKPSTSATQANPPDMPKQDTPAKPDDPVPKPPNESTTQPQPQTPAKSQQPQPQTPAKSQQPQPQTPPRSSQPQPQTPAKSHPPQPQTPAKSHPPQPQTPTKSEPQPQTPTKSHSPQPQTPTKSHSPQPQTPTKSEPQPQTPTKSDPQPQTPTKSEPQPQTPTKSDPQPQTPTKSDPQPQTPTKSDPQPQTPTKSDPQPQTPPSSQLQTKPELESEVQSYSLPPPGAPSYSLPPPEEPSYSLPPPGAQSYSLPMPEEEPSYSLPPPGAQSYSLPMPGEEPSYSLPPPEAPSYSLPPPGASSYSLPPPGAQPDSPPPPEPPSYSLPPLGAQPLLPLPGEQSHSLPMPEAQSHSLPMPEAQSHSLPMPEAQSYSLPLPEGQSYSLPPLETLNVKAESVKINEAAKPEEPIRVEQPVQNKPKPAPFKRLASVGIQTDSVLGRKTKNVEEVYMFGDKLGQGQFGTTYACMEKMTGKDFACKTIDKGRLVTDEDVEDVRRENQIMHHLAGHPNVIQIMGAYEDAEAVHLIMELCEGGELFDRIIERGHYTERKAAELARVIVGVVETCHSLGVMHRDLKPENFLFANQEEEAPLKAIDFGLSVFFRPGDMFHDVVGSPYYVAPEVLKKHYGPECDVWSAGVIIYILLCGVPPFWDETEQGIFDQVSSGDLDFVSDPWPSISESGKDLVQKMLERDTNKRPTALEVLRHPWVSIDGEAPDKPLDSVVMNRLEQFSTMTKLKKLAIRVIAELLSEDEITGLKEMFKMMDSDGSGHITLEELKSGLEKAGAKIKDSELKGVMQAADINNSGAIDYGEFLAAMLHLNKVQKKNHLYAAFKYFDKDGSGYITKDEIQQACQSFGLQNLKLDDMIREVDQDNDGSIDYNEFVAMMQDSGFAKKK